MQALLGPLGEVSKVRKALVNAMVISVRLSTPFNLNALGKRACLFLNWSKMVFILVLPVRVLYGLVLRTSLGRAEDGESWIRASS